MVAAFSVRLFARLGLENLAARAFIAMLLTPAVLSMLAIAAVQAFVYQTAAQWDKGEYPVREISQAKLLATQVAVEVADDAIQILGGHGYMHEFPVERAWRNARLGRIGAGSDAVAATMMEYSSAPLSSSVLTIWATVERFWPMAT